MICLTSAISSISEMDKVDQYISDIMQSGSRAALEQLYHCTKDAIYGYALSVLKNTHDAEDVLHDCYIAIYRSACAYSSEAKPMAWILTITRNLCLGKLRERKRMSDIPEEDWQRYLEAHDRISLEDKIVLAHCLKDLTDDERDILLLHILSGMKHREIAEMTGRPLSTILSKYHRSLKKLRVLLKEEDSANGEP